jgi:hypothetical protein
MNTTYILRMAIRFIGATVACAIIGAGWLLMHHPGYWLASIIFAAFATLGGIIIALLRRIVRDERASERLSRTWARAA